MAVKQEVIPVSNPFSLRLKDNYEVFAWTAHVAGGITVKIGCQEWPIEKWRKDGLSLITENHVMMNNPIDVHDINRLMFGTDEEMQERINKLVKDRKRASQKQINEAKELNEKLSDTLDLIEKFVAPWRARQPVATPAAVSPQRRLVRARPPLRAAVRR